MALLEMKEIEEDMKSDSITDKIEQVWEIFLDKLANKTSRSAPLTTGDVPTDHMTYPATPIVDSKAVSHSTPVKSNETLVL